MIDADDFFKACEQDPELRFWLAVYWLPYQMWRLWYKVKGRLGR